MRAELVFATLTFGLLLVLAPAGQAASSATVEAPVNLSDLTISGDAGEVLLHEGTRSLVLGQPTGSVQIWTYREPCFDREAQTCVVSNAQQGTTTVDITGGSLTVVPRNDSDHYAAFLAATGNTTFEAEADQASLRVLDDNHSHALYDASQAPAKFNKVTHTEGTLATLDGSPRLEMAGRFSLQVENATVIMIGADGEKREVRTGWTWEESDQPGFQDRVLRLVKVTNTGRLNVDWDGQLMATPELPLAFEASSAEAIIAAGSLAGHEASGTPTTIEDLEATIVKATVIGGSTNEDHEGQATGTFEIQDGLAPPTPPPEDEASTTVLASAGVAILASLAAAGYYWPRLSWGATVLVLPMYSRIDRSELLDNETREALYETVKEEPGIHAHALAETVDIGWGTTVYHLRRLEKNGMVTSEKKGRYRRFFPAAGYVARTREILSVLQNETTNDIAREILKHPGLNQKAICEALDISPSLANWHIKRLIEAELVEKERQGRTVHYTPGQAWDEVGDEIDPLAS